MSGVFKCRINRERVLFTSHARKNLFTVPNPPNNTQNFPLDTQIILPRPTKTDAKTCYCHAARGKAMN